MCLHSSTILWWFEAIFCFETMSFWSRSETDQILKMKQNPNWIYSAIFWLASTSPLELVFILITVKKQSHHFSSFADLLGNFWHDQVFIHKKPGKTDSNKFLVLVRHLFGLASTLETDKKSAKPKVLIPCLYMTFLLLFWYENLIEFKSN